MLSAREAALVVARHRYPIFARLSQQLRELSVVDARLLLRQRPITSGSIARRVGRHRRITRLKHARRDTLREIAGRSRIVLILPEVAFSGGLSGFANLLQRLSALTPDGSVFAICDEIAFAPGATNLRPTIADLPQIYDAARGAGLSPIGEITPAILDRDRKRILRPLRFEPFEGRFATRDWWRKRRGLNSRRAPPDLPFLGREHPEGVVLWPFVLFLEKTLQATPGTTVAAAGEKQP
jgi:hypothetical protein